jgi:hypothetical protein
LKEQEDMSKDILAANLKFMFDVDVDLSDIDDSPEGFARFKKKIEAEVNAKKTGQEDFFSGRKKTKKQVEREAKQEQDEKQKLKSIRAIYLSLAKLLHPDKEVDQAQKLHKEELMKKVISAYKQKDLSTLLKLELEWVTGKGHNIESLAAGKLKTYIAALREQVHILRQELIGLRYDPRFFLIKDFANQGERRAFNEMETLKRDHLSKINLIQNYQDKLQRVHSKKDVMNFVNQKAPELLEEEEDYVEDFDDLPW